VTAIENVTVVIRSCGERTTGACRALVETIFSPECVHAIQERPFALAVRRTFELGLDAARPWTLAIDADILVRPDALRAFVARADAAPPRCFELQGRILDLPFGGPRPAGPHLFRTALLDRARAHAAEGEARLRPEGHVIEQMAAEGFPFLEGDSVLGLHDYEQQHTDLFRKAAVHAHKHRDPMRILEPMWRRLARKDPDFRALRLGLDAGRRARSVRVDAGGFEMAQRLLEEAGLRPKAPLAPDAWSGERVGAVIDAHQPEREYQRWWEWQYGEPRPPTLAERTRAFVRRRLVSEG
jgi:hypothetical protein